MKSININQNKSGVTMFFVLMFMIIASLLGSSLMYLSSKQSDIGGDYFAKKTAEDAAESALDWFQGAVEDFTIDDTTKLNSVVKWVNDFDNNSLNNRWFTVQGANSSTETTFLTNDIKNNFTSATEDDADYITINGKTIKAKLRIENVDRINSVVVVKAIGYGVSNSKKTLRGVYKLEGSITNKFIAYDTTFMPDPLLGHAYYTDSKITVTGGKVFDISGNNVYVGKSAEFQGQVNVNGNFKTMGDMHIVNGGYGSIGGNLYVNGNFKMTSGKDFKVGYNNDAKYCFINGAFMSTSQGFISETNTYLGKLNQVQNGVPFFNGDLYIQEKNYGEITSDVKVSGDVFLNYDEISTDKLSQKLKDANGNSKTPQKGTFPDPTDIVTDYDKNDGTKEENTIDIDVKALTSQASFSLTDIKNRAGNTENFALRSENVNDLYKNGFAFITSKGGDEYRFPEDGVIKGYDNGFKETNGVMVINFDNAFGNINEKFGSLNAQNEIDKNEDARLAPGVKVAMAVNAKFNLAGNPFWSAPDPTSALGIFCNPTGDDDNIVGAFDEFKSYDVINGMFYSSKSNSGGNQYTNEFTGAVILKGENINYNATDMDLKVKYNDDVVRLFGKINADDSNSGGIFLNPDGNGSVTIVDPEIDSIIDYASHFSTMVIKPKLISKY